MRRFIYSPCFRQVLQSSTTKRATKGGNNLKRSVVNIFVIFPGIDAEKLLYQLSEKKIYVSTGSACDSKKETEDKSLIALGLSSKEIKSSLRISLPADVTRKEADYFLKVLKELIKRQV